MASRAHQQRVEANLLPRSRGTTYQEARKEWDWDGLAVDLVEEEGEMGVCQLCEHERLRYHHRIQNRYTRDVLWVGSKCIKRFLAPPEGESEEDFHARIDKAVRDLKEAQRLKRLRAANKVLVETWNFDLKLKENWQRGWSPKQVLAAFKTLYKRKHKYEPTDFKVNLRKMRTVGQMDKLSDWELKLLWPALSAAQRKRFPEQVDRMKKMGRRPPSGRRG